MNEHPPLLIDRHERISVVTLNRPAARNALNLHLMRALAGTLADLATDESLRCLVVTGAGGKAFCAGADLKERQWLSVSERSAHTAAIDDICLAIERFPTPVVAAIRGHALAGGAEIAVACDLRVMGRGGSIGFPEVRVGVFPGAGGVIRLPRIIGAGRARDLLMTGRPVAAEEALAMGLVDRVVPDDQVMEDALRLAEEICARAPLAVRALKTALVTSAGLPTDDARSIVSRLRAPLDGTRDYDEGLEAYRAGRSPQFSGQ